MTRLGLPLAALLAFAALPAVSAPPAVAATPAAGQAVYVPLDPVRLLDTREGVGAPEAAVGPGRTLDLRVADGVRVPLTATAVVLNVTATRASSATDVRVYPTPADSFVPTVSNLNVVAGATVANLVTVKVGRNGSVRLRNEAGQLHLVGDLSGYYDETRAGSTYVPQAPVRLLDTRDGTPLEAAEVRELDVRTARRGAASGVPADATAIVLNVTAVAPSASTDVRVYPTRSGGAVPEVSNVNAARGRTVPNLVVVAVGEDSRVNLRNAAGRTHLLADLAGWYVGGSERAAFHPVDPVRLLDSRETTPAPLYPAGAPGTPPFRLGPGATYDLLVAGRGAVPAVAGAVVLNVTAVGATASTDVRVYPTSGGAPPEVSNLNAVGGQTVPNAVVVQVGRDGRVTVRNNSGELSLVVDLAGWFAAAGQGWDISWPQCTTRGATTSNLPEGGAFAVVGRTRGAPFTDNECFAAQWSWASSLPGEPSVYLNTDAPGVRDSPGGRVWTEVCGTGTPTSTCGRQYGVRIAEYALPRLPTAPGGGKPMVWLDVEGPYTDGPFWQTGYAAAVAVNRAVINGTVATLRDAGYRVGFYSDRADSSSPDWENILGDFRVEHLQAWVFRAATGEAPADMCGKDISFSGGPVVMVQVQPEQSGQPYDVNHLC
ncbi:MAG: hypothetical protein WD794_05620 [Mycobacteriales bacterium]